ncbi:MAG: hypothetical protein AB1728_05360 [Bacteroidota bacterium]
MKHIEEHILEQYILNLNRDVISLRDDISTREIEQHLAECYGCRETVERIRTFYANLNTRLENIPEESVSSTNSLTRIEQHVTAKDFSDLQFYEELPMTFWGKVIYSAKRNPVAAGSFSFGIVALFAALIFSFLPETKDTNPNSIFYDTKNDLLVIRNREDDDLWKIGAEEVARLFNSKEAGTYCAALYDLDNDGIKEFITTASLPQYENGKRKLRVFNADKSLRFAIETDYQPTFRGIQYPFKFLPSSFVVFTPSHDSAQKYIVTAWTCGRSPVLITVHDINGNELGMFAHYGNTQNIFTHTLANGMNVVFLAGSNDIYEHENHIARSKGVLIALDPLKVIGRTESAQTNGFGLPASEAELAYIKFPWSELDLYFHTVRVGAARNPNLSDKILLDVHSGLNFFWFEFTYVFDNDLNIIEVKPDEATIHLQDSLKTAGKLTNLIDSTYLNNLKQRVEYWDGKRWENKPAVIQHF